MASETTAAIGRRRARRLSMADLTCQPAAARTNAPTPDASSILSMEMFHNKVCAPNIPVHRQKSLGHIVTETWRALRNLARAALCENRVAGPRFQNSAVADRSWGTQHLYGTPVPRAPSRSFLNGDTCMIDDDFWKMILGDDSTGPSASQFARGLGGGAGGTPYDDTGLPAEILATLPPPRQQDSGGRTWFSDMMDRGLVPPSVIATLLPQRDDASATGVPPSAPTPTRPIRHAAAAVPFDPRARG